MSGNIRHAFVYKFAEFIKLVVVKRGIEANDAHVGLIVYKLYSVKLEFVAEPVVAKQIHAASAVIV